MLELSTENYLKASSISIEYQVMNDRLCAGAISFSDKYVYEKFGKLRKTAEAYDEYTSLCSDILYWQKEVDSSTDEEAKDMASGELEYLSSSREKLICAINDALNIDEEQDIDGAIIEIRVGTGGDESALFVRDLYEMYLRYCQSHDIEIEVIDQSAAKLNGLKEVVLELHGSNIYKRLKHEGGVHRVQRVPLTEAHGRKQTSAVTVTVLPVVEESLIQINWATDVEEFVCRAGGPGGQKVNKTSSAVRLVHKATGISVFIRDEKSQHRNRDKARKILVARLYEFERAKKDKDRNDERKKMVGSGDRSERIRTYNFPQNRVTDHRINLDLHSLDKVLLGDLDELLDAVDKIDK